MDMKRKCKSNDSEMKAGRGEGGVQAVMEEVKVA